MVDKRAQQAMEFLMTYGWAILVIITAIAALAYFGIIDPARFLPNSCTLFPGLACTDFIVTPTSITLIIQNGYGRDITINSMNVIDEADGSICSFAIGQQPIEFKDGQQGVFSLGGCDNGVLGSKFKGRIEMSYIPKRGYLEHLYSGNLISKVEQPVVASCTGGVCSATPEFSIEEDGWPYWDGTVLLNNPDGVLFITSIDEGVIKPDYVIIGFPTLNIPNTATVSNPTLLLRHREDMTGCELFGGAVDDNKHRVSCYKSGWNSIGLYSTSSAFFDDPYSLAACVSNANDANNIIIKVTFDPPNTVCGSMDIDYARVDVTVS